MCLAPQCHALFEHLNFPKCYEHAVLNSKCASRRNAVHFFNISTSKSAPNPPCFLHFDVHMCLAPQRHALFEHVNFQQCYGHVASCGAFCIWTSKPASPHSGVQLFISHLTRWLRTGRFGEPTFRASGAPKTQWFATFLPFRAPSSSFF